MKEVTEGLPWNKATAGEFTIKISKERAFTFEYLTSCSNEVISSVRSPNCLKLSNIVPVHKKKDLRDNCNYRSVSILALLSKVFEKIMYDQLYMYKNNFLNELLCGFRKAHSTKHALFKLLQALQKELDNSGFIGTTLKDLWKAYDYLSHDLLIAELGEYGLDRSSFRLLMEYLNSRKQRTKVDSSYSKWSEMKHGIPQGSILGHILFNKIMKDLFFITEKSDTCNFTDDNNLYSCGTNLKIVLDNLNHDASKTFYWFEINSMKF